MMEARIACMDASIIEGPVARRPLVSVGIPTFNRPEGLRRTLGLICGQTYPNLEILISDNASPGPETEEVVREFAAADERIAYFRQPTNIGAIANFRFVLAKASGDYFMWAADDDEWDAKFVESCLAEAGPSCSVMTKFNTILRAQNTSEENPVPQLSPDARLSQNVANFFSMMQPSLFYGLHPRKSILFTLKGGYFDFYDCYVVLRIILESGFRTIDRNLYGAGVDAPGYEVKYADAAKRRLDFWPFFRHSSIALARSSRLSVPEKLRLWLKLLQLIRTLRRHHAARAS
jgi:glycosyltransferase involved in cell wall biosynthesis